MSYVPRHNRNSWPHLREHRLLYKVSTVELISKTLEALKQPESAERLKELWLHAPEMQDTEVLSSFRTQFATLDEGVRTMITDNLKNLEARTVKKSIHKQLEVEKFYNAAVDVQQRLNAIDPAKPAPKKGTNLAGQAQSFWQTSAWSPKNWSWGKIGVGAAVTGAVVGGVMLLRWMFSSGKKAAGAAKEKAKFAGGALLLGVLAAGAGVAAMWGWSSLQKQFQTWMQPLEEAKEKAKQAKDTAVAKVTEVKNDVQHKSKVALEKFKNMTGTGDDVEALPPAGSKLAIDTLSKLVHNDKINDIFGVLDLSDENAAEIMNLYDPSDGSVDMDELKRILDFDTRWGSSVHKDKYEEAAEQFVIFCAKREQQVETAYASKQDKDKTPFNQLTIGEYVGYMGSTFGVAFSALEMGGGKISADNMEFALSQYQETSGRNIHKEFENGEVMRGELQAYNTMQLSGFLLKHEKAIANISLGTFRTDGGVENRLNGDHVHAKEAKLAADLAVLQGQKDELTVSEDEFEALTPEQQQAYLVKLEHIHNQIGKVQPELDNIRMGMAIWQICSNGFPSSERFLPLFHKHIPGYKWDKTDNGMNQANIENLNRSILENVSVMDWIRWYQYDQLLRQDDTPTKISGLVPLQLEIMHLIHRTDEGILGRRIFTVDSEEVWLTMIQDGFADDEFKKQMADTYGIGKEALAETGTMLMNGISSEPVKEGIEWLAGKMLSGLNKYLALRRKAVIAGDKESWLNFSLMDFVTGAVAWKLSYPMRWVSNWLSTRTDLRSALNYLKVKATPRWYFQPFRKIFEASGILMSTDEMNDVGRGISQLIEQCEYLAKHDKGVMFRDLERWFKRGANDATLRSTVLEPAKQRLAQLRTRTANMTHITAKTQHEIDTLELIVRHSNAYLGKDKESALLRARTRRFSANVRKRLAVPIERIKGLFSSERTVMEVTDILDTHVGAHPADSAARINAYTRMVQNNHRLEDMFAAGARIDELMHAAGGVDELVKGGIPVVELLDAGSVIPRAQVIAAFAELGTLAKAEQMLSLCITHNIAGLQRMGFDTEEIFLGCMKLDKELRVIRMKECFVDGHLSVSRMVEMGARETEISQIILDNASAADRARLLREANDAKLLQRSYNASQKAMAEMDNLLDQDEWMKTIQKYGRGRVGADNIDDFIKTAVQNNALKMSADELRMIRESPRAKRLLVGAIEAGGDGSDLAEVNRIVSAARLGRNFRIGLNSVGFAGDLFTIYIAYADYMQNGYNLEKAKKTKNKELQELYKDCRTFNKFEGVAGTAGLVIQGHVVVSALASGQGLLSAAGATSTLSLWMLPISAAVIGGGMVHRTAKSATERWLRKGEDWKEALPSGHLLAEMKAIGPGKRRYWHGGGYAKGTRGEQIGRWLFTSSEDYERWEEEGEKTQEGANSMARYEITKGFLAQKQQLQKEHNESRKDFQAREKRHLDDQLAYVCSMTDHGWEYQQNSGTYDRANIHADLMEKSRRLKGNEYSSILTWTDEKGKQREFDLAEYADLPMHGDGNTLDDNYTKREIVSIVSHIQHKTSILEMNDTINYSGGTPMQRERFMQQKLTQDCWYDFDQLEARISQANFVGWELTGYEQEAENVARYTAYQLFRESVVQKAKELIDTGKQRPLTIQDYEYARNHCTAALRQDPLRLQEIGTERGYAKNLFVRDEEKVATMLTLGYAMRDASLYHINATETLETNKFKAVDIEQLVSQAGGTIKVKGMDIWVQNAKGYKLRPLIDGKPLTSEAGDNLIEIKDDEPFRLLHSSYTIYRPGEHHKVSDTAVMGTAAVTIATAGETKEAQANLAFIDSCLQAGKVELLSQHAKDIGDDVFELSYSIFHRPMIFWFDSSSANWKVAHGDWSGSEGYHKELVMTSGKIAQEFGSIHGKNEKYHQFVTKMAGVNKRNKLSNDSSETLVSTAA